MAFRSLKLGMVQFHDSLSFVNRKTKHVYRSFCWRAEQMRGSQLCNMCTHLRTQLRGYLEKIPANNVVEMHAFVCRAEYGCR